MTEQDIIEKLNHLADVHNTAAQLQAQKAKLVSELLPPIPPEIQKQIDDIEAEFAPKLKEASAMAGVLESEIKPAIVAIGHSVKADELQGVFVSASPKWNTDALAGYAAAHSEILQFCAPGKPSSRIMPNRK